MKKVSLIISLLLTLAMLIGLIGSVIAEEEMSTPLVVAYDTFNERFSPFFSQTAFDGDVAAMTSIALMRFDRASNIVWNGIEGETIPYGGVEYTYYTPANLSMAYDEAAGITTYTAKLREGMVFSDGVPVTADDLIFTYYVFLDTDYVGSTSMNSYPIIGLENYRTQTTDDVFAKYSGMAEAIYAAGEGHVWSEADGWTQEQQDGFWAAVKEAWIGGVQEITDFVFSNYAGAYAEDMLGVTAAEAGESGGLKVALGMILWGFADTDDETGGLTGAITGESWSMEGGGLPGIEDYYTETYLAYDGDIEAFWIYEAPEGGDLLAGARGAFISEWGPKDDGMGDGGIANIAGIKKLDEYTVQVQVQGFNATAVYPILGIEVSPLHYYGDVELYDYENNMFGFPRGDLSIAREKMTKPLGAGAYKYAGYENKVVYFEANGLYWKGEPVTQYIQFKETLTTEQVPALATGAVDIANINGSKKDFEQVASHNSNGEITGDVITTSLVDNRGYGYIGMNAGTVLVGADPFSAESKYLRKALGTVLAVYRDVAYDSYFGEAAAVINYPISNTSWAAPQPTDEGYKVAFSVDVDGNDIYAFDMPTEAKYAAALEAAVGFLKAAGFTYDEAAGVFTDAPQGAKLSYEITLPGFGVGDHPSFAVATDASNALAAIGITLKINDLSQTSILWDMVNAGTQELWTAAWQSTPDPDMYQVYHSANIIGRGGTDSNSYHVDLPELDDLIMEGRTSADQAYRKGIYRQALDIIVDAAVEIPAYQRQNAVCFSTERVNIDSVTPDITTWWDWGTEIELIAMNANQ